MKPTLWALCLMAITACSFSPELPKDPRVEALRSKDLQWPVILPLYQVTFDREDDEAISDELAEEVDALAARADALRDRAKRMDNTPVLTDADRRKLQSAGNIP